MKQNKHDKTKRNKTRQDRGRSLHLTLSSAQGPGFSGIGWKGSAEAQKRRMQPTRATGMTGRQRGEEKEEFKKWGYNIICPVFV